MKFGWKVLLPLAVVNLLATAAGVLYFGGLTWLLFYTLCHHRRSSRRCSSSRSGTRSTACSCSSRPSARCRALYVLLDAPFVAVIQIIVYAGAIMVLFLFVVMLLNAPQEDTDEDLVASAATVRRRAISGVQRFGAVMAVAFGIEAVVGPDQARRRISGVFPGGSVSSVGDDRSPRCSPDYAFPFEVTSILILIAMVGAVVLARREAVRTRPFRPSVRRPPRHDADAQSLSRARQDPVRHRYGWRLRAPQPDHDSAVDRNHAECRESHVRRLRAGTPVRRTARSSCSSS